MKRGSIATLLVVGIPVSGRAHGDARRPWDWWWSDWPLGDGWRLGCAGGLDRLGWGCGGWERWSWGKGAIVSFGWLGAWGDEDLAWGRGGGNGLDGCFVGLLGESLLGHPDDLLSILVPALGQGEGVSSKGGRCQAVDGFLHDDLVHAQADKVGLFVHLIKLTIEPFGVGSADDKGNEGADIAEDGLLELFGNLANVLVCNG